MDLDDKFICTHCGTTTRKLNVVKENYYGCFLQLLVAVVIFVTFIAGFFTYGLTWIIAVIFLIWEQSMLAKKREFTVCPNCKTENCMVPISSPKGKQLVNQYYDVEKIEEYKQLEAMKRDMPYLVDMDDEE